MIVDSHCHLPHEKYQKTQDKVVSDAYGAGVTKLISIGTSIAGNLKTIEAAEKYPGVFATIAVYPHEDQDKTTDQLLVELEKQLLLSKKIIAIGECGIDIGGESYERNIANQIVLFEMQLALACEKKLPVVIHNRGGDDLIFDILDKYISKGLTGVAHCFSSSWEVAQKYLDRGIYLSFSAMITYKTRDELREVVKKVPLDMFLFETDAPYLPPQGFRGQPNEPALVTEVVKKFAEVRGIAFDTAAELSYSSTHKLFKGLS